MATCILLTFVPFSQYIPPSPHPSPSPTPPTPKSFHHTSDLSAKKDLVPPDDVRKTWVKIMLQSNKNITRK